MHSGGGVGIEVIAMIANDKDDDSKQYNAIPELSSSQNGTTATLTSTGPAATNGTTADAAPRAVENDDDEKEAEERIAQVQDEPNVVDGMGRRGTYTGRVLQRRRLGGDNNGDTTNASMVMTPCDDQRGCMIYVNDGEMAPVGDTATTKTVPPPVTAVKYVGPWNRQGLWHGDHGQLWFASGDVYQGSFVRGMRHGLGLYRWSDGLREYVGQFDRNERHGQGKYTWNQKKKKTRQQQQQQQHAKQSGSIDEDDDTEDGDEREELVAAAVYEGSFSRNQREGHGKYVDYANRLEYTGDWKGGAYGGYGIYTWRDKEGRQRAHRGMFENGKPHGTGVQVNPDGSVKHDGEWKHGKPVLASEEEEHAPAAASPRSKGGSSSASSSSQATSSAASNVKQQQQQTYDDEQQQHHVLEVVEQQPWVDQQSGGQAVYRGLWHRLKQVPHGNGTAEYIQNGSMDSTSSPGKRKGPIASAAASPTSASSSAVNVVCYEGCFAVGLYHGHGRIKWSNGDSYEGAFQDGWRHGHGVYAWHDGRQYAGEFVKSQREGSGTFLYPNQDLYQGEFLAGKRHGTGRFVFYGAGETQGAVYTGQWAEGLYHGTGCLVQANGNTYQGEFHQGLCHGQGKETTSSGRVLYEGTWDHGKQQQQEEDNTTGATATTVSSDGTSSSLLDQAASPDSWTKHKGSGTAGPVSPRGRARAAAAVKAATTTATAPATAAAADRVNVVSPRKEDCQTVVNEPVSDAQGNGGRYTGILDKRSRQPHGVGRLVYSDGKRIHEGFWLRGNKHGHGRCLFFPQGDFHEGEYRGNLRHGPGRYQWQDGRRFVGTYRSDLRHGRGTFTYPTGEVYTGEFSNGQRTGYGRFDFGGNGSRSSPCRSVSGATSTTAGYYEGEWLAGKYHGQGKLVWKPKQQNSNSNGDDNKTIIPSTTVVEAGYYQGEFAKGVFHGMGKRFDAKGNLVQQGRWEEGSFQQEQQQEQEQQRSQPNDDENGSNAAAAGASAKEGAPHPTSIATTTTTNSTSAAAVTTAHHGVATTVAGQETEVAVLADELHRVVHLNTIVAQDDDDEELAVNEQRQEPEPRDNPEEDDEEEEKNILAGDDGGNDPPAKLQEHAVD